MINSCSTSSIQKSLYHLIDKIYIKGLERQSEKGIGYKMILQIILKSKKHLNTSKKFIYQLQPYFSISEETLPHYHWILSQMFEHDGVFIHVWKQLFKKKQQFESDKLVDILDLFLKTHPENKPDIGPTIFIWFLKKSVLKKKYQEVYSKLKSSTLFSERYLIKFLEKLENYSGEVMMELTNVFNTMMNPHFIELWIKVHSQYVISSLILFHSKEEFLFKYQKELDPIRSKYFPSKEKAKEKESSMLPIILSLCFIALSIIIYQNN